MIQLLEYNTGHCIQAFSTMRGEGFGCYGGFNITPYCGDEPQHVELCRAELCKRLDIEDNRLILPYQTHSDRVAVIDNCFLQLSSDERDKTLQGVDAVITNLPHTCIGVSTADCIPILLHDTAHGAIAAIHAGWRGTVAHIACRAIERMQEHYGTRPSDIRAIVAPGISIEAFEVGDEVYEAFCEAGFNMPCIAKRYPTANGREKWHIDLWEANSRLLQQCGVEKENIHIAGICTYAHHTDFFSARRLGIKSGRIFSGIMLRQINGD